MAFNPYSIRPIGQPKFEDHMLDVYTSAYYHRQVPYQDDLQKEAAYGEPLWKSEQEVSPDEALIIAVTGQAVLDYIDCWEKREIAKQCDDHGQEVLFNSRCLDLENDFFRRYEVTEDLFDELLYQLHTAWSIDWLRSSIRSCYKRFINNVGREKT